MLKSFLWQKLFDWKTKIKERVDISNSTTRPERQVLVGFCLSVGGEFNLVRYFLYFLLEWCLSKVKFFRKLFFFYFSRHPLTLKSPEWTSCLNLYFLLLLRWEKSCDCVEFSKKIVFFFKENCLCLKQNHLELQEKRHLQIFQRCH